MNPNSIKELVDSIHRSHLDNARTVYVARKLGCADPGTSISPLSNFVFEFFLFNSLYCVDWPASLACDRPIHFGEDYSECKMQRRFLKFCRDQCKERGENTLSEAFRPLAGLHELAGDWTVLESDSRVSPETAQGFFEKLAALAELARHEAMPLNKATYRRISNCCNFVYMMRNSIFHGDESLDETYQRDHARRIGVYDLFVRSLNAWFFLSFGKQEHGAAYAQLPMAQRIGAETIDLTQQDVYRLLHRGWLKPEDSALHWKICSANLFDVPPIDSDCKLGFFYPSSGDDLLFPLLVGLPSCTDFFFYDSVRVPSAEEVLEVLSEISSSAGPRLMNVDNGVCFEFEFNSVVRRIHVVRADIQSALPQDIRLAFFFQRGGAEGEGGSNQRRSSDLLAQLLSRKPPDQELHILTDVEPTGVGPEAVAQLTRFTIPGSQLEREYYFGSI